MNSTTWHGDAIAALRCPRCPDNQLELAPGKELVLRCTGCSQQYPFVGTIPCLVEDPLLWRALWRSRLDEYLHITSTRVHHLRQEAQLADLLPRTRERMLRVVVAIEDQRARIQALLGKISDDAAVLPPSAIPSQSGQDDKLAVLECYEHVFRDWGWGEREGELSRLLVERAVSQPLGRLAVYGAGAARLALDVHCTLRPTHTFALDINPLPLLIAAELLRGESLEFYEFPVAPISDEQAAVLQHLHSPVLLPEGFALLFADALRPPFAPSSLDSVLTPWFIDAARADLRETVASINRVLRPGGVWINVGPLRFNNAMSRCYSIEEVFEIVTGSGFELLSHQREALPYFDSPSSGSRRTDTVVCFAARKTGEAPPVNLPNLVPRWVTDPRLPIPVTPAMTALRRSSVFAVGVIALVDGTRSIADLARSLASSWGVDPALVQDQLRAFFAKLPPG
jgi:SAM-dependent methyltransferase/uncharacterized protein YbaR (Trm112 family)